MQATAISKTFQTLEDVTSVYFDPERTASVALLTWFLENIYRLDRIEAQDAVCDQTDDKGIDALVINDEAQELIVFQAKRRTKPTHTVGDTTLKDFVGTLEQFATPEAVVKLAAETRSTDLKRILIGNKVAEKIAIGYNIRPLFVTNVPLEVDAQSYLAKLTPRERQFPIDAWDNHRLQPVLDQLDREWTVDEEVKLRVESSKLFVNEVSGETSQIFAAIPAKDLAKLPGIQDFRIFAQNVRLGLGNTRVNKDIVESIQNSNEHTDFLSFHNGLTVVAKELFFSRGRIVMNHYSVCNGCQSLLQFQRNKEVLSDELEVLVRFVRVGDDRSLSEKIAYRTNNQNSISLRDLSSNDPAQIQLKAEFDNLYGIRHVYDIRRGAASSTETLTNEAAGQMLLSLYGRRPWDAHQKYRIFGDFKLDIFNYQTTAARVRLAQLLHQEVGHKAIRLSDERIRKYGLTQFLLLFLLGEVIREEEDGPAFLDDPRPYLMTKSGDNARKQGDIMETLKELADEVVDSVDFYISDQKETNEYDYKSLFKSREGVAPIKHEVLLDRRKAVRKKDPTLLRLPN